MGLLESIFRGIDEKGTYASLMKAASESDAAFFQHEENKIPEMKRNGKVIEKYTVMKSHELGLPYPCLTFGELKLFEDEKSPPLEGDTMAILNLMRIGIDGQCENLDDTDICIYSDPEKTEYWRRHIEKRAREGDRRAQAALISKARPKDWYPWRTAEYYDSCYAAYAGQLLSDAENGDAEAMYAVALHCLGDAAYGSSCRTQWFVKAADGGVSDALYMTACAIEEEYIGTHHNLEGFDESPQKRQYTQIMKMCAESDSKIYAPVAQACLAFYYTYDADKTPENKALAEKYNRMAGKLK